MAVRSVTKTLLAGVCAVCALGGGAALADTQTLFQAGPWSAFGGTSDDGTKVCGIDTQNADSTKFFFIKYFQGSDELETDAVKTSWNIPDGTNVPLTLKLGANSPWSATGDGSGTEVTWFVPSDAVDDFQKEFEFSRAMVLSFDSGNEAPWSFDLSGSYEVFQAFYHCVAIISGGDQPTQPYGQSAAPPATTQPYTAPSSPAEPDTSPSVQPKYQPL